MANDIFDELFLDEDEQKRYELVKLAREFITDDSYKLEVLRRDAYDAYNDAMKKMRLYLKFKQDSQEVKKSD